MQSKGKGPPTLYKRGVVSAFQSPLFPSWLLRMITMLLVVMADLQLGEPFES